MPSRRDIIAMTPAEIRAYLSRQRRIIVVTNGPRGFPHPVPMDFGLDAEGRVLITTFRKSQKVKNLERDPRATLLVESGEAYAELKSVIVYADAQVIHDSETIASVMKMIGAGKESSSGISPSMRAQFQASLAKRVVVRFTPLRTTSWDHGKLGEFY